MRRFVPFFAFAIVFLSPLAAGAVIQPGTIELSLSPSIEIVSIEDESGDSDSETILMLPVRLGVFATRAFQIEGDINVTSTGSSTGMWAFLNAVYNFETSDGKVRPFVLVGLGLGNAARILGLALDTDESVLGFDLGAGAKFHITDRVAFRAEYRYDNVSYDSQGSIFFPNEEITVEGHRFLFGFSVFFNQE